MEYLNVVVFTMLTLCCLQQVDEPDYEATLGTFDFTSQLSHNLDKSVYEDFLELVDEQKKQISKIKRDFEKERKSLAQDPVLSDSERLEELGKLKTERDRELLEVLLPNQRKLLKNFPIYASMLNEGFANSLVNGTFAIYLELSKEERTRIRDEAAKVLSDYQEDLAIAQRKAVTKLMQALPDAKRSKLNSILKPILRGNGTLYPGHDPSVLFETGKSLPFVGGITRLNKE